jgi:hypothetical protein
MTTAAERVTTAIATAMATPTSVAVDSASPLVRPLGCRADAGATS